MANKEYVILVNELDEVIGSMEKMEAHQKGVLHRAFSVFLFNSKGEMLLQQRAACKYHSPNKWTNACCSHQRSGETTMAAAKRRLEEELGITACEVQSAYSFIYKADVGGGLFEHEYDHVLTGKYEGEIPFNEEEVQAFKYLSIKDIEKDLQDQPENYTEWFKITFNDLKKHINGDSN